MSMSKKDFIALADEVKRAKGTPNEFSQCQLTIIADFCQSQNCAFMYDRWMDYINGECGKNGGKVNA
jgi:hypothetical protein